MAWQCQACGRVYLDDVDHELRAFRPDTPQEDLLNKDRPKVFPDALNDVTELTKSAPRMSTLLLAVNAAFAA